MSLAAGLGLLDRSYSDKPSEPRLTATCVEAEHIQETEVHFEAGYCLCGGFGVTGIGSDQGN